MDEAALAAPGAPADEATQEARRGWYAVLAKASLAELDAVWDALAEKPDYRTLRHSETGLVMVRGRIGGTGAAFNLGEMTMTRAAIQVIDAAGNVTYTGFGYVAGRAKRHAQLVALFDALLQDPVRHGALAASVVVPLAERQAAMKAVRAAAVMASKVDFFTMVRGE